MNLTCTLDLWTPSLQMQFSASPDAIMTTCFLVVTAAVLALILFRSVKSQN